MLAMTNVSVIARSASDEAISLGKMNPVFVEACVRRSGMNLAIGCDHRGLKLKQFVMKLVAGAGHSYSDFGCSTDESVDYPDIAQEVARAVARGDYDRGILICGTGIGMCIVANKVKGIRAALCYDALTACRARQHNDANILCLGEVQSHDSVREIVNSFLSCEFQGGRHQRRVDKIRAMEG